MIYIKNKKQTDAKALVSIQGIAALNINLGGFRTISKNVLTHLNLTFQALSKENNKVFLSSENISNLVLDILGSFTKIQQHFLQQHSKILKYLAKI